MGTNQYKLMLDTHLYKGRKNCHDTDQLRYITLKFCNSKKSKLSITILIFFQLQNLNVICITCYIKSFKLLHGTPHVSGVCDIGL